VETVSFPVDQDDPNPRLTKLILMLKDVRESLLRQIKEISQETLDFTPNMKKIETIGTLLLHIAGVEWSWIFEDIDKMDMNFEEWKYSFALRQELDPPQLTVKPLSFYLDKLSEVRNDVLIRLNKMTDADLETLINVGKDKFTTEWIIYHIYQHESVHIGQINFLKRQAKISLSL
jgi:uncharacterized damage-inducible protein DinB